jgi:deoxycytidylate deaminase
MLIKTNPLFDDPIFKRCLVEAARSDCQKSKYGCVVVDVGEIILSEHNKVMRCMKDWAEPECIRKNIQSRTESMIGCCSHAEENALGWAIDRGMILSKLSFYVAGIRSNGDINIMPEKRFTCLRCATQFYLYGVNKIFVPVVDHWEQLTSDEAIQSAKQYALGKKRTHE